MKRDTIILGAAVTGAKYTPANHKMTGNVEYDEIMTGLEIRTTCDGLFEEAEALFGMGVRYYHYHGRDPGKREQTTDIASYSSLGKRIKSAMPDMVLSYGASRNGQLVREAISMYGETCRSLQAMLPMQFGGAEFITVQAAAELQVVRDAEKQGFVTYGNKPGAQFHGDINCFVPTVKEDSLNLEVFSTAGGGNYGSSSSAIQFSYYRSTLQARRAVFGDHEVEWVQRDRSYAMTRLAILHDELMLGSTGNLAITLLFGFSPKLRFPLTFEEFRETVRLAKSLEEDLAMKYGSGLVTITVGCAVLPSKAKEAICEMDIGSSVGTIIDPLQRLVEYSCQPDSGVDIIRFGMEDTPYRLTRSGELKKTNNIEMASRVLNYLDLCNRRPCQDKESIANNLLKASNYQKLATNTCSPRAV